MDLFALLLRICRASKRLGSAPMPRRPFFHGVCILKWVHMGNHACPYCRAVLEEVLGPEEREHREDSESDDDDEDPDDGD